MTRPGLTETEKPENVRRTLRLIVARIEAHPDGRLAYKTSPVDLLRADGAFCGKLVAGARYAVEKKIPASIIDFHFAKRAVRMLTPDIAHPLAASLVA